MTDKQVCRVRFFMIRNCIKFGESIMSKTQVQLWYNRFKEDQGDAHPGRPSTLTTDGSIEAVKKMILNIRQITIRQVVC